MHNKRVGQNSGSCPTLYRSEGCGNSHSAALLSHAGVTPLCIGYLLCSFCVYTPSETTKAQLLTRAATMEGPRTRVG